MPVSVNIWKYSPYSYIYGEKDGMQDNVRKHWKQDGTSTLQMISYIQFQFNNLYLIILKPYAVIYTQELLIWHDEHIY